MKKKKLIIILVILVLLVLLGFYLYYENTKLQVSNYNITDSKIPSEFNNYKIVQVSDFHNTKSKNLTNALIKEIENQKPNIIVITGDLIDSNKTNIDTAINFVKSINEIALIYFVTGNHEAHINNYDEFKEKLEENKVNVLDSETELLKIGEAEIELIGINDPQIAHENYLSDSIMIKKEINENYYLSMNYKILLSHRPELLDTYAQMNMDLVLAGHAHGGQIRIPFIGGLVAPNQGFFPKYTSGIYEQNGTTMVVSRGIGNSILPFRINNRPELVVVTLHSK